MKATIAIMGILFLAAATIPCVRSDELNQQDDEASVAEDVERELLNTLRDLYQATLEDYKTRGGSPSALIRVNEDWLTHQIMATERPDHHLILLKCRRRAAEIEAIARIQMEQGTGTQKGLLEAKASQLKIRLLMSKSRTDGRSRRTEP